MAYSYNRKYEMRIGTPTIDSTLYTKSPEDVTAASNLTRSSYSEFSDGSAVKITDLHFTATINRTSKGEESNTDSTSFEIYNMSAETRKYAEQEGALIILKAGYDNGEELPLLYAGQIKSVSTSKSKPDTITTIIAGDAYIPQKNTRISKYYPNTMPKSSIIEDLALSLPGVGEGAFATSTLENLRFNGGFSASGKVTDVLNKLCKSLRHTYVIENNRVYVFPKTVSKDSTDFSLLYARALSLSSNQLKTGTGKMNNNTQDLSNEESTKAGYKFVTFLNGLAKVASYTEITDGDYQGVYKNTGVKHMLDYRGANWNTEIYTEGVN